MLALPISKPRFRSIIFYQNSLKIKSFEQKNAKFSIAGLSAPRPPCLRRLGAFPPSPQLSAAGVSPLDPYLPPAARFPNQPPIANFWLRACKHLPVVYGRKDKHLAGGSLTRSEENYRSRPYLEAAEKAQNFKLSGTIVHAPLKIDYYLTRV